MVENNKKPEIRFTEYTDSWEQRKLGSIAEFNPKAELPETFEYVDLESVVGTEMVNHREERKATAPSRAQRLARQGDLFYQTVRPYQRNNYLFEKPFNNFVFSTGYAQMRPHVDGYFLLSLVQNNGFVKSVLERCTGTSYPAINSNDLADMEVYIPVMNNDQVKIGKYFKGFDSLITLHQRKHDKLVIVKKSMLEKMFPSDGLNVPEIRFKGFTDAWEQRELEEISDKVIEKNVNLEVTETFTNSAELGIISQRDYFDHDVSNAENLAGYYVVKNDDFVYNPRISTFAPVGPINRNKLGGNGVMSPLYTVFRTHDIDNTFLEQYFKSRYWHSFMKLNGDSGARSDRFSIKDSVFMKMLIPYPTLNEQLKIAEYLTHLDNLISLHRQKLEKLKNIKNSMLEKMFV